MSEQASGHLAHAERSGCIAALCERKWLLPFRHLAAADPAIPASVPAAAWVEHPRVSPWTYPYEWPSSLLREAALLHLDIQLLALEHDVVLSDASAYNVQFIRGKPTYVDLLSLRQYREGAYWIAHRQFCEQFLAPLLLGLRWNITWQAWYRGALEGIPLDAVARMCKPLDWCSLRMLMHVLLPARLSARSTSASEAPKMPPRPLPKTAYRNLLRGLRDWIASMSAGSQGSLWEDYATSNTYAQEERQAKRAAVADFVDRQRPRRLIDLGCNSGEYAAVAMAQGVEEVIGFDADSGALAAACRRAERLPGFLPLFLDAANPSPSQGWRETERASFSQRFSADGLIALAFAHHLAVARNTPLDETMDWVVRLAPTGLIEFVGPGDPTVVRMLRLRDGPLPDWDQPSFEAQLRARARIVRMTTVSSMGRCLYEYERNDC